MSSFDDFLQLHSSFGNSITAFDFVGMILVAFFGQKINFTYSAETLTFFMIERYVSENEIIVVLKLFLEELNILVVFGWL